MSALVVKIGGSLWRSPQLGEWITALRHFPGPVTVVPGGGPFADAVRAAQKVMGFSDAAAHEMALLAMEQYGLALVGMFEGLTMAPPPAAARRGEIRVWRPSAAARVAEIPASWDMTSDSLAAWFARSSGANRLLLIKSVDLDADGGPPDLCDPYFPAFAAGLQVFVAGPRGLDRAAQVFARGDIVGARLDAGKEKAGVNIICRR
ncbi:MAG TPA: aspartate kinase [Methylocystis sp.]|nr:aspartate kinase [Methylocystis sp.]